jgi:hypothetical protein
MGLRSKIDSSAYGAAAGAGYLKGSFGVKVVRESRRAYPVPEWMHNEKKIGEFIRKLFPHAGMFGRICSCDPCSFPEYRLSRKKCRCRWCRHTTRAEIWVTVISRYFLAGQTDTTIEMQCDWKKGTVGQIAQKIRRLTAGQRQDGLPRTGRPRGRPKKISVPEPIIPDNRNESEKLVYDVESTVFANSC